MKTLKGSECFLHNLRNIICNTFYVLPVCYLMDESPKIVALNNEIVGVCGCRFKSGPERFVNHDYVNAVKVIK